MSIHRSNTFESWASNCHSELVRIFSVLKRLMVLALYRFRNTGSGIVCSGRGVMEVVILSYNTDAELSLFKSGRLSVIIRHMTWSN